MRHACLAGLLAAALLADPAWAEHRREREIRARAAEFATTWATNDPQKLSAFFETHGDLLTPSGRWVRGRMEIEKNFQEEHSTIFKGSRLGILVEAVRFLSDDIVFMDGTMRIEGAHAKDGSAMGPRELHLVVALRRDHDRWYFAAFRVSVPPH